MSRSLYNAARLAGLEIVDGTGTPCPSPNVKEGFGATVADKTLDLKFKNNFSSPVYISAQATNGRLAIKILGKTPSPQWERSGGKKNR